MTPLIYFCIALFVTVVSGTVLVFTMGKFMREDFDDTPGEKAFGWVFSVFLSYVTGCVIGGMWPGTVPLGLIFLALWAFFTRKEKRENERRYGSKY